jgi:hypothetical protein
MESVLRRSVAADAGSGICMSEPLPSDRLFLFRLRIAVSNGVLARLHGTRDSVCHRTRQAFPERLEQGCDLVSSCEFPFTAQAPAFVLAGASGWAVNE